MKRLIFCTSAAALIASAALAQVPLPGAELTLQMALLSERKVAKVIALREEQRAENPLLPSRRDPEAEKMAQAVDSSEALERLEAARPALD